MKNLVLPVLAAAVVAFASPSLAMGNCGGTHKDQTAEQPQPEPVEPPST